MAKKKAKTAQRPPAPPVTKKAAKKKTAKRAAKAAQSTKPAKPMARRADFGAPVDAAFEKQPPHLRAILDALRSIIEEVVPDAEGSLKWGMPFYCVDGKMMCALGAHKAHVNLILAGPPSEYKDAAGRLQGEGKTGRRLTLENVDELPQADVTAWVRTAARLAREGKTGM